MPPPPPPPLPSPDDLTKETYTREEVVQLSRKYEAAIASLATRNKELERHRLGTHRVDEGSQHRHSSHLGFIEGIKRNGILNPFYFHSHETDERTYHNKRSSHVYAWLTLGGLTVVMGVITLEFISTWSKIRACYYALYKESPRPPADVLKDVQAELDHYVAVYERLSERFMATIGGVRSGNYTPLFLAGLSHAEPGHLFGNLFALWLFGFKLCRIVGASAFLSVFAVGGVTSVGFQLLWNMAQGRTSPLPPMHTCLPAFFEEDKMKEMQEKIAMCDLPVLGASGSIMAIAGWAARMFPKDKVLTRPLPFPMPIPIAVALFAASDVIGVTALLGTSEPTGSEVGHMAHLSGLLLGFCAAAVTRRYARLPLRV